MTTAQITDESLCSKLDGLFGLEKTVDIVESPTPIEDPRVISTYLDMDGNELFAIVCELSLANSLGAALTRIPSGGADDATSEGVVPDNIGENLYEVLNIAAAVFADYCHKRIVVDKVLKPGDELPEGLTDRVASGVCLLQVDYEIENYTAGKMSLIEYV